MGRKINAASPNGVRHAKESSRRGWGFLVDVEGSRVLYCVDGN